MSQYHNVCVLQGNNNEARMRQAECVTFLQDNVNHVHCKHQSLWEQNRLTIAESEEYILLNQGLTLTRSYLPGAEQAELVLG